MDLEEIKRLYREHFSEIEKEHNKYKYPGDSSESFESFMYLNKVNENTITNDMMEWYAYHICDKSGYFNPHSDFCYCPNLNSYINEMLNKTSLDLLVKTLNRELPGTDKNNFVINETDFEGKVNILLVSEKIYDREKIATICDKMMWSFTSVEIRPNRFKNPFNVETPYINTSLGYGVIRIKVEPIKTKNITDFVKNNCGGKIYHICNRIDLDRIMKSGLRIKGEKNDYRYFKNKVYFFCGENKEDLYHNLSIVGQSKWCWVSDYSWIDEDDYALLEIDVNDYNIDFYMDGYYFDQKPYIGYTYNYFPPRRIREVDYDELNWI